jgi:hypothetical protein
MERAKIERMACIGPYIEYVYALMTQYLTSKISADQFRTEIKNIKVTEVWYSGDMREECGLFENIQATLADLKEVY